MDMPTELETTKSDESEGCETDYEDDDEGEEEILKNQLSQFFSDLNVEESNQKKRLYVEKFTARRRRSTLPHHLHSVMGSANWKYAQGQVGGAIKLCKEVIRQAPHSVEPYVTLAAIFEEQGEQDELLKVLLIASSLKRSDVDLWVKCAFLAKKMGNVFLTKRCISKALALDPQNVDLLWEQFCAYSELKKYSKALTSLETIRKQLEDPVTGSTVLSQVLPESHAQRVIEVTKEMAQAHHALQETSVAVQKLSEVMEKFPENINPELLNIFTELSLAEQNFEQVYESITKYFAMLPDLAEGTSEGSANPPVASAARSSSSFMPDLTKVLRLSISGYNVDVGSQSSEDEDPYISSGGGAVPEGGLIVPAEMPVDLRTKLAIAMVNTNREVPEKLLEPVFFCPEDNGDLLLDLADTYFTNAHYAKALPMLSSLVRTEQYSQSGVWLKHGDCLQMLGELEEAVVSYNRVLTLSPGHTDTRLKLATLYHQLGCQEDAIAVLEVASGEMRDEEGEEAELEEAGLEEEEEEDLTEEESSASLSGSSAKEKMDVRSSKSYKNVTIQEVRVNMHKYKLLLSSNKMVDCVKTGEELLAFFFRSVYSKLSLKEFLKHQKESRSKKYVSQLKSFRNFHGGALREATEVESLFSEEEWFDVFKMTCKGLLKFNFSSSGDRITYLVYCASFTGKFRGPLELPFICFSASLSYIIRDYPTAFVVVKEFLINNPESGHVWNIVSLLPLRDSDKKVLFRICHKTSSRYSQLALANLQFMSGMVLTTALPSSIAMYEKFFREGGARDPLPCLYMGVAYINQASPIKNTHNRQALVILGLGFLHTYVRLRGVCQESMYNMGRALHQIGVSYLACYFYKKVLTLDPESKKPEWSESSDLQGEAAYNLALIYRASGNNALARHLLWKYCSV